MGRSYEVDLLVIGGGIHGAGIARDASGRGLKVCLVEQGDLAAATSSASTKLIHGGLRYLEYGEISLVRAALTERERLLAIAPHIIEPLRFVLPHAPGLRSRWLIRLGLFVYDHIGGRKRLPASQSVRLDRSPFGTPLRSGFKHGFAYSDCRVDDSRLVVLNAMDAAARGALILTQTRLVRGSAAQDRWHARCESLLTGETIEIKARALVNASGAALGAVRSSLGLVGETPIRLIKGSHILVPRLFAGEHAYILQNPDGRIVFAIPYERRFTLVGTTDVACDAPVLHITPEETGYLCDSVNRYFKRAIATSDVVWSYAGVRALTDDRATEAAAVTRDYDLRLEHTRTGAVVLSVIGGKITTYRCVAETALALLRPVIGGSPSSWTHAAPLPGGDLPGQDLAQFMAAAERRWRFLPQEQARRLARSYGTRMEAIIGSARCLNDLGERFGAQLTEAEVDYLRAHEWALTAQDILWRRSKLGLQMPPDVEARLRAYLHERDSQLDSDPSIVSGKIQQEHCRT
jgi:glycerol-3-phosphate dehydrogenase